MAKPRARARDFGRVRKLPSGRWQASYTHDGSQYLGPNTWVGKQDATGWLAKVRADIERGEWVDPASGKVTFREFAEQWRAMQVHRAGTAVQLETYLRRWIYPALGDRPLQAIRPSHVQAAVKAWGDSLAPASVELCFVWTSTIFRAAVNDGRLVRSPCVGVRRPQVEHREVHPLPVETVAALEETIAPRYRALVVLGAGAGLRISEALGLTNDRVDWLRKAVRVDRQLAGVDPDGSPRFGPVKDKRNRPRTVPVPDVVVDALAEHVATYGLGPGGLIFTGPRGGAVRRSTFSEAWRKAAGPLGVAGGDGYHQLRHYYASVLIRAGESVKVVQKRLGHTSATMTLDVYGHLWPEDDDSTRDAVQAALASLSARSVHGG